MERVTGILSPVASLPSRHGIGDFGKESYRFAELSAKAGFRLWQVLPLNPLGYGHSPYQPFSSYAIDELYCDLDALKRATTASLNAGLIPIVIELFDSVKKVINPKRSVGCVNH